jgi:hypothetical protein
MAVSEILDMSARPDPFSALDPSCDTGRDPSFDRDLYEQYFRPTQFSRPANWITIDLLACISAPRHLKSAVAVLQPVPTFLN